MLGQEIKLLSCSSKYDLISVWVMLTWDGKCVFPHHCIGSAESPHLEFDGGGGFHHKGPLLDHATAFKAVVAVLAG